MRQGQNNSKRSRGRGGRKPQHSTNRAYDSNGPDVKIRGNAAHVCEKYQQLARDAISAGDRIAAENYYQHAEHYYRLLLATQQGQEGQQRPQTNLAYRPDEDEENENDFAPDGPQPRHPGQPWHQQNGNNGNGQNGHAGNGQSGHADNGPSSNGNGGDAASSGEEGEDAAEASASEAAAQGGEGEGGQPRRRSSRRRRPRAEGARPDAAPAESGAE